MSLRLDLKADKVPVALVDGWMGLGGLGEVALGQTLDLAATAGLKKGNGPLSLKAKATHASLDIDGRLRQGVFGLKKPLVGRLEVTEQLGSKLLNKIHPIFETVSTAEGPIELEIGDQGFSLPLKDFDIARAVVPRISVASNKMTLRKGGTLDMLVSLARQFGGVKGLGESGEMEVWFTPVVAGLQGGLFSYTNRIDLLIDRRLHALSWGSVALGPGGSSYELKLGLPAESLRKVLGTNRVGEGEILVIPLVGREGKLDMKSSLSRATLDLGRVRGQYELAKKDPLLGLVVGQMTKKAVGTDPGIIPPPSVTPFPWAGLVKPEPIAPEPAPAPREEGKAAPPAERKTPAKEPKPEDIIREVLPEELKGVLDIFK
jgi:hypothetical protein